jgi:hypothetical protein
MRNIRWFVAGLAVAIGLSVCGSSVTTMPYTFTNGTVADATQVNANFAALQTAINDNATKVTALQTTASNLSTVIVGTWGIVNRPPWNNDATVSPWTPSIITFTSDGNLNLTTNGLVPVCIVPPLGLISMQYNTAYMSSFYTTYQADSPGHYYSYYMVGTSFPYILNGDLISVSSGLPGATQALGNSWINGLATIPGSTCAHIYCIDNNTLLMVSLYQYGGQATNSYILKRQP